MKQLIVILTFLALLGGTALFAQDPYIISGKILSDSLGQQPLASASIRVKGSSVGTTAAEDGSFHLKTSQKLPLTLVGSSIGFKSQEFVVSSNSTQGLTSALTSRRVLVDHVVVTANRLSAS